MATLLQQALAARAAMAKRAPENRTPLAARFARVLQGRQPQGRPIPLGHGPGGGRGAGGGPTDHPPVFPTDGGGPQSGYQGLQGVIDFLSRPGGISQAQFDRLNQGYTGANGIVGNALGRFKGLSPYAVHFLASSGLLAKNEPAQIDTANLTGDELFKAQLQNSLAAAQPATYNLHSGIDSSFLQQLLAQVQGGGYAKGYDASGKAPATNPITGALFH
jgi:hypothetical protein